MDPGNLDCPEVPLTTTGAPSEYRGRPFPVSPGSGVDGHQLDPGALTTPRPPPAHHGAPLPRRGPIHDRYIHAPRATPSLEPPLNLY